MADTQVDLSASTSDSNQEGGGGNSLLEVEQTVGSENGSSYLAEDTASLTHAPTLEACAAEVEKQRSSTARTHLPSPAPSLSEFDVDSSLHAPASGKTSFLCASKHSVASTDRIAFDGLTSCAVSEAESSAPPSAVESPNDTFLSHDDIHTTARRGHRRTSSSYKRKTRDRSWTKSSDHSGFRRLSASKIHELTQSPESLPIATVPEQPLSAGIAEWQRLSMSSQLTASPRDVYDKVETNRSQSFGDSPPSRKLPSDRPSISTEALSPANRKKSRSQLPAPASASQRNSFQPSPRPTPLKLEGGSNFGNLGLANPLNPHLDRPLRPDHRDPRVHRKPRAPSPLPPSIPLPPLSAPSLLQLELAAQRPSPLYIHRSYASDLPYESSAVKFERLKNFLLLPPFLEKTLMFGALACLDAWLWTFTILPMRFCIAFGVLARWWIYVAGKESRWLIGFVWEGTGRLWQRGRRGSRMSRRSRQDDGFRFTDGESRSRSRARDGSHDNSTNVRSTDQAGLGGDLPRRGPSSRTRLGTTGVRHQVSPTNRKPPPGPSRHKRTKSTPSNLTSFHKADLLQGLIIICSSTALMNLDASRMYHFIRAQSAVKLYVIYNLVEVADRLLSALGQDTFECLFSEETLSRTSSGRSKVVLPFGVFLLSLTYNCVHAITLFYQVITLNVAVNSYSNALLTLLMSNQFVEIKSSVFKRFEKENTFQLTCADIVERFQLWLVLLIVGMRNVVEVGGLSIPGAGLEVGDDGLPAAAKVPLHSHSILPMSFTIMPSWLWSGEVLSPFLIVIGSEMLVDWIKHAYINKFNNIRPEFYSRILDILCKDYYTNAFITPSLTRRLGLPLLPLSTLYIRACVQTYHMFLATHLPAPIPRSTQTSLSVESTRPSSPAVTAALDRLDQFIRNALGRSVYGFEGGGFDRNGTWAAAPSNLSWFSWSTDDAIALMTMTLVFFIVFLILLILKLLLGMFLLRYSRDRYMKMKLKEHAVATGKVEKDSFDTEGSKRIGGFGAVELGDERRRWIYADDAEGLKRVRGRERKAEENAAGKEEKDLNRVMRYEMVAKRIW